MARVHRSTAPSGHVVLVIDDRPEVVETSRKLLEAEGHRVLAAANGPTGLAIHARERPHLLIVDYFMPEMTGEEVVRHVRAVDPHVQIILSTGYSGEKPPREMMRQLDIQGYHDKSEGAQRLLLWVDSALKAYRHVLALQRQRAGLEYLVNVAPDAHRLQRLDELLPRLLWQLQELAGGGVRPAGAEDDVPASGFVALSVQPQQELRAALAIRAGQGRFFPGLLTDSLADAERAAIEAAVAGRRPLRLADAIVLPLRIGPRVLGVIYLETAATEDPDPRLLEIFGTQAACAVQSALLYGEDPQLYEMATRDAATGLMLHGHWSQLAQQAVKSGARRGLPVSAVHLAIEGLDALAHRAGPTGRDRALRTIAELVGEVAGEGGWATRTAEGELAILLPDTGAEEAERVAESLLRAGSPLHVELDAGADQVRLHTGCAAIDASEPDPRFAMSDPDDADRALAALLDGAWTSLRVAAAEGRGPVTEVVDPSAPGTGGESDDAAEAAALLP